MSDTSIAPNTGSFVAAGIASSIAVRGFLRGPTQLSGDAACSAVLNILNAQTIKAQPGVLVRLCVVATGSGGSLTLNDSATLAGAAAGNEILTIAQSALSIGQVILFAWPCASGITISAVPSGSPQLSVSFT